MGYAKPINYSERRTDWLVFHEISNDLEHDLKNEHIKYELYNAAIYIKFKKHSFKAE